MERWGFLFSVMSSPIVYFLTILLAVCPNINPTILCAHVCDVNYAACYITCIIENNRFAIPRVGGYARTRHK